ncbi:dipeptidase PepV [Amedibacillus sp. YH-ame6]
MDWMKNFVSYEDAFIKDLKGLIAIDSQRDDTTATKNAPFGKGCREALDYMLSLGERDGFVVRDIDGYAGVIEYGEGEESVGVLAHLDIVPIEDGWTRDPFGGEIEKGYMFGRGTLDDKGPAMAGFYALKMLRDQQIKLNKKVMLILGCDEETGMECMEYYVKHAQVPTLGFTPDADFPVIYGEKGGLHVHYQGSSETIIKEMHAGERPNVVIGKASAILKKEASELLELFDFYLKSHGLQGYMETVDGEVVCHIEGVSAHGATPYLGVNAALHILNFVGHAYQDTFAKHTYEMLHDWMGKSLGIAMDGAYMGFLTMNTGVVNISDKQSEIIVDIRYPNDADVDAIEASIVQHAKALNYPLQVEVLRKANPLFVDPNSHLVTTLSSVYRKYSHDDFTPNMTIGGGTYAKKFSNFVAFGPEFPNQKVEEDLFVGACHQRDEGIKLENLYTAVAIYSESIEKLAE